MADTLTLNLTATITEGSTSQTNKRIYTLTDAEITEDTNQKFSIAPLTTDHLVALGEVTPLEHFVVEFSGPVTIRINDVSGTQISLPGAAPFFCFSGASVTAIYVTNAGASAITATLLGGFSA